MYGDMPFTFYFFIYLFFDDDDDVYRVHYATESSEAGRCVTAVKTGEECTYNYGPKELLGWDLEKRRSYLSEKNGFVCRCERCCEEAEEERQK